MVKRKRLYLFTALTTTICSLLAALPTSAGNDTGNWYLAYDGPSVSLQDLVFTDANSGWGVGLRGTVLHTTDGGSSWKPQESSTYRHLYAVDFTDASHGWAVGSRGIIARTSDGGQNWITIIDLPLSKR